MSMSQSSYATLSPLVSPAEKSLLLEPIHQTSYLSIELETVLSLKQKVDSLVATGKSTKALSVTILMRISDLFLNEIAQLEKALKQEIAIGA